jgi:hypothetical protein
MCVALRCAPICYRSFGQVRSIGAVARRWRTDVAADMASPSAAMTLRCRGVCRRFSRDFRDEAATHRGERSVADFGSPTGQSQPKAQPITVRALRSVGRAFEASPAARFNLCSMMPTSSATMKIDADEMRYGEHAVAMNSRLQLATGPKHHGTQTGLW